LHRRASSSTERTRRSPGWRYCMVTSGRGRATATSSLRGDPRHQESI
jgi:hypothetical protein